MKAPPSPIGEPSPNAEEQRSEAVRKRPTRKLLILLLKATLSACLLIAVILMMDIGAALALVAKTDLAMLAAALGAFFCVRVVTALRWFLLLRAYSVQITYLSVLRIVFISTAVGQFVPGGADAVGIYQVFREGGRLPEISVAVILDRLLGVASMLLLASSTIFLAVDDREIRVLALVLVLGFAVLLAGAALLVRFDLVERLRKYEPAAARNAIVRGVGRVTDLLSQVGTLKQTLWQSAAASVTVQLLRVLAFALIFASLGQSLSAVYYLAFIPLAFVVLAIPISIGGFGVRESTLAFLFSTIGVPVEVSVTAGLLAPVLVFSSVIPGVLLFSLWRPESGKSTAVPAQSDQRQ